MKRLKVLLSFAVFLNYFGCKSTSDRSTYEGIPGEESKTSFESLKKSIKKTLPPFKASPGMVVFFEVTTFGKKDEVAIAMINDVISPMVMEARRAGEKFFSVAAVKIPTSLTSVDKKRAELNAGHEKSIARIAKSLKNEEINATADEIESSYFTVFDDDPDQAQLMSYQEKFFGNVKIESPQVAALIVKEDGTTSNPIVFVSNNSADNAIRNDYRPFLIKLMQDFKSIFPKVFPD